MNTAFRLALITGLVSVSLAGCKNAHPASTETATANDVGAIASPHIKDSDASHSAIIAAAEPFEALTEQAATATPTVLGKLVDEANSAAEGVSAMLDQNQRDKLTSQLANIMAAQKTGDYTAMALASVEGYRTLIESAADTGMTPRAVSLLDYAGFRYQANLAANPVHWANAEASVDFADSQWAAVSQKIANASLRDQMTKSIADMRRAALAKDTDLAKSSSTTELELVDKLEAYFEAK